MSMSFPQNHFVASNDGLMDRFLDCSVTKSVRSLTEPDDSININEYTPIYLSLIKHTQALMYNNNNIIMLFASDNENKTT